MEQTMNGFARRREYVFFRTPVPEIEIVLLLTEVYGSIVTVMEPPAFTTEEAKAFRCQNPFYGKLAAR